jgi:HEPN domain-containing protein
MSAQRRIDAFFILADRGLRSANTLFREGQLEDAALFVQQVAERAARALLTNAGVQFGTSHSLDQMANALPAGHPFKERIQPFDTFSSAVTAFRYPTSTGRLQPPPSTDELREALVEVEQLVRDAKLHVYGPT